MFTVPFRAITVLCTIITYAFALPKPEPVPLAEEGITDFLIVEARDELGGRMRSAPFGEPGHQFTVELGANWIQGTQEGNGPANPILVLARNHNLSTAESDFFTSMTTYDQTGAVDYLDVFNNSVDAFTNLTVAAGARVPQSLVDLTARTGYSLMDQKPKTPQEKASEYFQFDWEYAQTPEQSSFVASSWGNNFTYNVDQGGFSGGNLFSIDQRGFKHLIQAEAAEFLNSSQVLLNATVSTIEYSDSAVSVTLTDGTKLNAKYAICTFSLGVLQNDDVRFEPALPGWKAEAIQSMTMFWFDTQYGLYADTERGRYPVWQGLDLENFLPGSGIVFVTVTGDYSERIEALSDAQVQSEVLGVLRAMYPNVTIPDPTAFFFPRWFSDPLYRGSYSNWPASFVTQHHTNLRASLGRLWFSGEALSEKYFGFLHGAYFEGEATGASVAQCLKGQGCAPLPHITKITNSVGYDV
ncbi:amine oxidase [Multifurca ochricompacta]|uniref:Amine oxidase n=1 Tax=Multifurca ochricompacta TaxID=376703 RepID=A0AAD4M1W2_9AGAM|nr:amine oxidase [Multifurca ochricompacta]